MRKLLLIILTIGVHSICTAQISSTLLSSDDSEPIIGATIVDNANASNGVTSDIDGKFTITLTDPNGTVTISYLGMKSKVVQASEISSTIYLDPNVSLLKEVVVIGYGYEKRSNIKGAVSVISSEEITELPSLRVEQALQGRSAGVQVSQNSGSPGSTLSVRVRGVGTINNSDPLYIVDGVQVGGLDFLSTNDIESINVLKDAASSAIYGSRGANGVVLITTKSGDKTPEGSISYETYFGVQSVYRKLNLLSAREYAIIQNESSIAAGVQPLIEFSNPDALGEGTDWQDAIFESAPISNHQLTFTKGNDKSSYLLGASLFQQEGIIGGPKSRFDRVTARMNGSHKIKPYLTIGSNINFTYLTRDALPENNEFNSPLIRALNMDPVTPIKKADGTFAYSRYADTDITNPVNAIELNHSTWTTHRVVGSLYGIVELPKNLSLKSSFSVDANLANLKSFSPTFDLSNDPVLSDAPAGEKRAINSISIQHNQWRNWQWENTLNWNSKFGENHNVGAMIGNTIQEHNFNYSGGSNSNLPSNDPKDAFISNTIDPIATQGAYEGAEESALLSYFTRVNYDYRDKYLFSATMRADGSSKFGANNRFGYFPSFSAAWILSEESFFSFKPISFFKVRTSWGQNGNDQIGNYGFTSVVSSGQNYAFGPDEIITNGSVALTAANPDLKWESIAQTNIGVDLEFWSGLLNVTADVYSKKTTNMLYAVPIPLTGGTAAPIQNVGTALNTGLELAADYRNTFKKVKYSIGGNMAFVKNELTSLGNGGEPLVAGNVQSANATAIRSEVGRPIASFYGYVTDGIFQSQNEVNNHAFQAENTAPGDIRFKDLNDDGVIDEDDQDYLGNAYPNFTYGVTANVEFMNFDLSIFGQGSYGNEIYNGTTRYDFVSVNRPNTVLNRWTGPGTSDFEPRVNRLDPNQNVRISDRFIEDGSYFKLKNIQLGYAFKVPQLGNVKFEKVRAYLSCQNLFTITKYSGFDPEIGTIGGALEIGIDRGFYPQARTVTGGLQIKF